MFIKSENPSEKKIEMHVQFEKCNFKIENTKIRIGKSEKNSIFNKFENFNFNFLNLFRLHSTDLSIPDLNPMKTSVKGTV